jgi:transcriptional regulator of met regulon
MVALMENNINNNIKVEKVVNPIHSATDSNITDDTIIYYYKGRPVYIDFLLINEFKKSNEIDNYLDQLKKDLTIYKCN